MYDSEAVRSARGARAFALMANLGHIREAAGGGVHQPTTGETVIMDTKSTSAAAAPTVEGDVVELGASEVELLKHRLFKELNSESVQRERHKLLWVTSVVGLIASLATAGLVFATKAYIDRAVWSAADDIIEKSQLRLEQGMSYHRLAFMVSAIEATISTIRASPAAAVPGIGDDDRAEIMILLKSIAEAGDASNREHPELRLLLKRVMKMLYEIRDLPNMQRIDELFRPMLIGDSDVATYLIDIYAESIIGSGISVGEMSHLLDKLKPYMLTGAPSKSSIHGQIHFWKLLIEFKRSPESPETKNLAAMSSNLIEASARTFRNSLWWYEEPEIWQPQPTSQGKEIARIVRELREAYSDLPSPEPMD